MIGLMFRRARPVLSLLLSLTFGATSAAPDLFHACHAGTEMAARMLGRSAELTPSEYCGHAPPTHRHGDSSHQCHCLGHSCCTTALALQIGRFRLMTGAVRLLEVNPALPPTSPPVARRYRHPPALAPPLLLA